jgi:hypothetical protein
MKIKALALTLIIALLYSAVVGTGFVDPAIANPLWGSSVYKGEVGAPSKPTIIISSPKNNTRLKTNSLSVTLNVSIITTNMQDYQEWISRVYYKSDWLQEDTYVYEYYNPDPNYIRPKITEFYYRLNLTEIPEGVHKITFHAVERGFYCPSLLEYYGFSANDSSVVVFTIDTTPPSISVLSLENRRFNSSDVPLNFGVDEPFEKASYVLDGQQNVTITGNTTLTGLPNGDHNVTIYAIDEAGNTGVSETIYFSIDVPEPFPTAMVVAVSVAIIALVGVGLLVYFKKRKH